MPLSDLSDKEKDIVYECLKAVVYGPFIPDYDFHSIFGLDREDVTYILKQWPALDDSELKTKLAINNSMNNLWGYPIEARMEWDNWISVNPDEVHRILKKWKSGISWPEKNKSANH